MADELTPALSAEEWADAIEDAPNIVLCAYDISTSTDPQGIDEVELRYHALAALALHGQPFGFTHAHAWAIREAIDVLANNVAHWSSGERVELLHEAAARIAALLPPEGT